MESVLTPETEPKPTLPPMPGQLIRPYRVIVVGYWVAIISALGIVAVASEVVGRQVWWIGDDYERAFYLTIVPALAPLVTIIASVYNRRWVVQASAVATTTTAVTAFLDRHRSPGAAVIEAILAVSALLLTIAATSGMYRKARETPPAAR